MRELEMFLDSLKSNNTRESYERNINHMLSYVEKPINEIKAVDLIGWQNSLSNLSSASQAQYINAVKSFFRFLYDIEYIQKNPAEKLHSVKVINKPKDYVDDEQVLNMINTAKNKRDKAIIALLFSTGLRVSELINIELEDLQNDSLFIQTKGGKYREIFINDGCRNIINEYLKVRKDGCSKLFVSNQRTPMLRANINNLLTKVRKQCGIKESVTPHSLRHTFVTDIAREYGVETARDAVGHSSIAVTNRYIHGNRETVKKAMMGVRL